MLMANAVLNRKRARFFIVHWLLVALSLSVVLLSRCMHGHRHYATGPSWIRSPNVAIVMSDSRSFTEVDSYNHWSFLANLRYAATHAYALRYYHIIDNPTNVDDPKNKPTCYHQTHGWRSSPWCKLVAILHTLEQGRQQRRRGGGML